MIQPPRTVQRTSRINGEQSNYRRTTSCLDRCNPFSHLVSECMGIIASYNSIIACLITVIPFYSIPFHSISFHLTLHRFGYAVVTDLEKRDHVGYPTPSRKRKGAWSAVTWCHAHSIPMVSRPPKGILAHVHATTWLLVRQEVGRWVRVYEVAIGLAGGIGYIRARARADCKCARFQYLYLKYVLPARYIYVGK